MQNNTSKINTVIFALILIMIVVVGIILIGQKKVSNNSDDKVDNALNIPAFIQEMIDGDTMIDKVYKYTYQGNSYYYLSGWEKVDGAPRVFAESGTEMQCNFRSPMVPVNQNDPNAKPVNPVCQGYESGELIYERK